MRRILTIAVLLLIGLATGISLPRAEVIGPVFPELEPTPPPVQEVELWLAKAEQYGQRRYFYSTLRAFEKAKALGGVTPKLFGLAARTAMMSGTRLFHPFVLECANEVGLENAFAWEDEAKRAYATVMVDLGELDRARDFMKILNDFAQQGEEQRRLIEGMMFEVLKSYLKHFGNPMLSSDAFIRAFWDPWDKNFERFMGEGDALLKARIVPDAILAYKRAALFTSDTSKPMLGLAKSYALCGDQQDRKSVV